MLILNAGEVRCALPMETAMDTVASAYASVSRGESLTPLRTPLELPKGTILTMPAYLAETDAPGVKIVSVFPENATRGLPTITGLMILLDGSSGIPLAAMDAASLTAIRTGASGGVAAQYLARQDVRVAAVIGAGVQGRTQLQALAAVRALSEVRVYDVNRGNAEAFIEDIEGDLPVLPIRCDTAAAAVRDVDVILCATTASSPVFSATDLEPGAHVTGVGSFHPGMAEIGIDTLAKADRIVVDSREACLEEAGDFIQPISRGEITAEVIDSEIGEIVLGQRPGRSNDEEITVFKAVGLAALDIAVAEATYRRARERGMGTEVPL